MYYLLKTEPTVYGFADLQKEQSTIWDGVTNPVAVKLDVQPRAVAEAVLLAQFGDPGAGG